VVGLAGTGKSSVVAILREVLEVPVVYFGGVVVAEVQRQSLPVTEATERRVREQLRSDLGMSAIAQLALEQIDSQLQEFGCVIIDGLYSYAEYELLQERYFNQVKLIAVHASKSQREKRLAKRKVRPLSAEEMHSRDLREVRTLDKATAIALADWHLVNNSTIDSLRHHVKRTMTAVQAARTSST
jgi:dephospho-CoA kinase